MEKKRSVIEQMIPLQKELNYTLFRINELMNQADMGKELKETIKILQKHLSEDKSEGSYYHSWQANIAMVFYDEMDGYGLIETDLLRKVSNQAAKNFLDLLIKQ